MTAFTATEIDFSRSAAASGAIIIVVGVVVRKFLTMFQQQERANKML